MNILVEINHPAQVHKLKNLIKQLELRNKILVLSRDKEVTLQLLEANKIKNKCISKQRKFKLWLLVEFIQRLFVALYYIIKFKPEVMFGFSAINICLLGKLFRIKTLLFADTEDAGIISKLTFPYASKIIIPATFKRSFGNREIRFKGTHELSYLMNFKHDKSIYSLLGIKPSEKYVLLRFISWQAVHDTKEFGLSYKQKIRLINLLNKKFKIFISSEKALPKELNKYQLQIPPHKIHDVMCFADLFIGESQSMATEAALLGTPSIRYSSLVGKMHALGQYNELQKKGLVYSTKDEEELFKLVEKLVNMKDRKKIWQKRRDAYFKDKDDPTDIVLKEIYSKK